jgi:RNA polymerase sigma-70 factor, ECF subfamily
LKPPHIQQARVVGFLDLVGQPSAFILPLFQSLERDNYVWSQELDVRGRIARFQRVSAPSEHFTSCSDGLIAVVGEEGVWGFQWEKADFAIDREAALRTVLVAKNTIDRTRSIPLLHLEVINFCRRQDEWPKAVLAAYDSLKHISPRCADLWRGDQIIAPAIRSTLQKLERALLARKKVTASLVRDTKFKIQNGVLQLSLPGDLKDAFAKDESVLAEIKSVLDGLGLKLAVDDVRDVLISELSSLWSEAKEKRVDGDQIDEVINEVVVHALSEASGKPRYLTMRQWLSVLLDRTIARSSNSRMQQRKRHVDLEDVARNLVSMPEQEWKVRYTEFQKALNLLPRNEMEAVVLVTSSGFSYADAAAIMGCSVRTVKSRVNRGLEKLREMVDLEATRL